MSTDILAWTAAFAVATSGLLLLPFVPAWREWRRPTDQGALDVPHDAQPDTDVPARAFLERMRALQANTPKAFEPIDSLSPHARPDRGDGPPLLAARPIRSLAALHSARPVYAVADLELRGAEGRLSRVAAEGRLRLGPRTRVSGLAHAEQVLEVGEGSVVARRATSSELVELSMGSCFERVHAPEVRFGVVAPELRPETPQRPEADLAALPGVIRRSSQLYRVDGDCVLPDRRRFRGSLVVTGVLTIGEGTVIEGDVKARKGVLVGRGAVVRGSIVCENGVHVLAQAQVAGPVLSETHLLLASGVELGSSAVPTTVSAEAIIAEQGVVAHGTVWARRAGVVWGPV